MTPSAGHKSIEPQATPSADVVQDLRVVATSDYAEYDELWRKYVSSTTEESLYFSINWDAVFSQYGLRVLRLIAMRSDDVVGVLPLVWQKSRILGNRLVSLPWFDVTGVLADDDSAAAALIHRALHEADARGVRELQIRQREQVHCRSLVRTDKFLLRLALTSDPEALWSGFKPKVRNQIRKAEKHGLVVEKGGEAAIAQFFAVYAENMRDLGSPSHSLAFFQTVFDQFASATQLYLVKLNGETIGAGWTMSNGACLEIPWASSKKAYNHYCVNHAMYWRIIEDACRAGYRWFHFGRSTRDSGQFRFKLQWNADPVQLYWCYLPAESGREQMDEWNTPPALARGARIWKRLPVAVAKRLGPQLIRYLP